MALLDLAAADPDAPAVDDLTRRRTRGELIDRAGCRGLRHGGAMVSEKHCNFLINTGGATAALSLAGQGLRDVTRIAASDPRLWASILVGNAGPVGGRPPHVGAD